MKKDKGFSSSIMSTVSIGQNVDADTQMNKAALSREANGEYRNIPADKIKFSPYNEGLDMDNVHMYAESMKQTGMLEPIVVYAMDDGTFEILTGHQRFEAWCKELGHDSIKAVVKPYEHDPVKRFKAHTEANTLTRNKDLRFWLSRIEHARSVLKETGFSGSKDEETKLLSSMLNGISRAQLYRYDGFARLIPELQDFESKHWLSAMTLYAAQSLKESQQKEVADRVLAIKKAREPELEEKNISFEITRDEFKKIVDDVRAGKPAAVQTRKKGSFGDRVSKASMSFLKVLASPKTEEDKTEVLHQIQIVREELDRLEGELKK